MTHGIPRYDVRRGALVLRNTLPYMPVGVHVAVVDPQVGTERRALALRCDDGRVLVGPDNGLLSLAWEPAGGVDMAVDVTPLAAPARARVGHLPRPRRVRAGGGPPGGRRRAGRRRRAAGPGGPGDGGAARAAHGGRRARGARAHASTASATPALNVAHDELAGTGITLGADGGDRGRRRALPGHLRRAPSPTWARAS